MTDFARIVVSPEEAAGRYTELRREYTTSGLYPLLMGRPSELDRIFHLIISHDSRGCRIERKKRYEPTGVASILAASEAVDVDRYFKRKAHNRVEDGDDSLTALRELATRMDDPRQGRLPGFEPSGEDRLRPIGSPEPWIWSDQSWGDGAIRRVVEALTWDHPAELLIGLFPVGAPWEVFAHLAYGDWNGCPGPVEQCAIHRSWLERFGSEVVSITGDTVQCLVGRPPRSDRDTLFLAREQYLYCDEGVHLEEFAADLFDSRHGFFWWD